jgi:ring-1,2-phenylacetyl-CoA epoxidase subunit PaaE
MSEQFHSVKIQKTVAETDDAVSIYLDIPKNLKDSFKYIPGQYITFEVDVNGEKLRRAYSLCTSPSVDDAPAVTVKRVDKGRVSNYLNDNAKAGEEMQVMAPNGKFTLQVDTSARNHYVLFGGGSGITPLMAILKTVLHSEPNSRVTLVYCNRDEDSVIFEAKLEQLKREFLSRFTVHYSYDNPNNEWDGLTGYLTENKVAEILSTKIGGAFYRMCKYYICGPSPLMAIVKDGLKSAGVPDNNVNTEYFAAPASSDSSPGEYVEADEDFSGEATLKLEVYGEEHEIKCGERTTILDAAIAEDLDPPYSCTVGVCTTCRAKVIKGKVEMLEREGLSDDEIENGYVLTCQSQPRSNNIELVYE